MSCANTRQYFPSEKIQELKVCLVTELGDELLGSRALVGTNLLDHLVRTAHDGADLHVQLIEKDRRNRRRREALSLPILARRIVAKAKLLSVTGTGSGLVTQRATPEITPIMPGVTMKEGMRSPTV